MRFSRILAGAIGGGLLLLISLLSGPAGYGPGEPQSAEAADLNEVKKLLASDAETADFFSRRAVAISGDTIVVGANGEDAGGNLAGAAYVFERNEGGAGNWGEVTKLTASDAEADDRFGQRVAVDSDTIVVGANREDEVALNAGAVYIFQRDEGGPDNWGEVKKLTAADAEAGDEFGFSAAVSGDTIVVGANGEDEVATSAGAVYIFQRDEGGPGNWGEVKKLKASDAEATDRLGESVAISSDTIVVGANGEDEVGGPCGFLASAGAAYIFGRDEGGADNWGEVKKLKASDANIVCDNGDNFGVTVAVNGDTVVVGANRENTTAEDAGAAYVFERNEGGVDNWGEVKKLTAPIPSFCGFFGSGVAVGGNTVVVGSYWPCGTTGNAYAFGRNQGGADNWGQVNELIPSDGLFGDTFGDGAAISGNTIVVAAPLQDEAANGAGAVYLFECAAASWSVPVGDTDCDSFTDTIEAFVGTDPNDSCANTAIANDEADDRWPADTNDNQFVNVFDVVPYIDALNSVAPNPPYFARLDLNMSGNINVFDVVPFIQLLNEACLP